VAGGQPIGESEQAEEGSKYRKAKVSGANQDKESKGSGACKGEESKACRAGKGWESEGSRAGETGWYGKDRKPKDNRTDTNREAVQQGR